MSEPITRALRVEGDGQRLGRGGGKETMKLEVRRGGIENIFTGKHFKGVLSDNKMD